MRLLILPLAVLGMTACNLLPPPSARLNLSNFGYDRADVEAVVTANPDCNLRGGGFVAASAFSLPLNGTRTIEAPAGADVCWRRDLGPGRPAARQWSPWDRAYLSAGGTIDSTL